MIASMVFFALALVIISTSVITTNQQVERLNKQEELAKNIELEVDELSDLSIDYLLYHEDQQIDRWNSKYSSFFADASNLTVEQLDQQVLVNNIKANGQRLKEIFDDTESRFESAPTPQQGTVSPAFIQVSWSRMGVQTQGIVFDASRLAQSFREQSDQMKQKNNLLVFSLMGAFIALLLANYLLFYRGTLRSIEFLQTGTKVIGSGNLDFSLEEKRNDEIGELSKAFNLMTANLKTVTASKADLEREINERKKAVKEIESLAKFPEEDPNLVIRVAIDGKIVYANPSSVPLLKAWGRQVDEMLPDDYKNLALEARRSGNHNEIEVITGGTVYSLIITPIADTCYVNIYGRDVTQQRLAEKARKESEQRFRDAIDNFPNVFVIYDADRRVTYVNSNGLKIMGLTEQEVIGKKDEEIFPPEMIDSYLPALKLAVDTKTPQVLERTRSASMGGQAIIVNIVPLLDDNGEIRQILGLTYDITERIHAEEARKVSEELYRSLFNSMTEGFALHEIILDENCKPLDYRFLDVNPAFERLTGLRREDVIGKTHNDVLPGDSSRWIEEYGTVALTGEPAHFDNYSPVLRKHYEVFAYRPAPGQFAVLFMDVAERKRQEKQITKLTKLYSVLSRVNEAIVRVRDEDSLYTEICRIVAETGGYPLAWIGQIKDELVMPVAWSGPASDYLKEIRVEVRGELGKGPTGTSIRENRSVINDDFATNPATSPWRESAQRYCIRASAAFPLLRQGKVIGSFTIYASEPKAFDDEQVGLLESLSADISYALDSLDKDQLRVLAEEDLRGTKDYLENLIDYANAPIIVWDPSFKITRFNHAFERLTGLRASEVLGEQLDILFPEESRDASLEYISRTLSGERWEVVEIPILRTDGSIRTVLWNSANIYENASVVATIAQGQDITDRKKAEEDLRKARDELEQRVEERTAELSKASMELEARAAELARKTEDLIRSNSELEQFAYVASHDLQEPLRMISSYVQLLSRRYEGKLDKDADDFIAYAVEGTKRMQQLINDLLAYSRVGTRGKPLAPTDFEDVYSEAMANLRMAAEEAGAVVTHDQLPTAMADRLQMVQLFQNLIGNAIKFRDKDVPQVHVSARPEEKMWVFSVRDNGIGIDPQFHDRIFTIFQRLHGRDEYPGTGIGLAVSKKIVERHGGRIWLESSPGIGTTFYFTVPIKAEQAEI